MDGYGSAQGQQDKASDAIELSIEPSLGFNFSFPIVRETNRPFEYTKGSIGSRDFYWGINLKGKWNNNISASLILDQAWYGGGFKYNLNPKYPSTGSHTSFRTAFSASINIEKTILNYEISKNLNLSGNFNFLFGSGFYALPKPNRNYIEEKRITMDRFASFDMKASPLSDYVGIINIGVNNQFFLKRRDLFKIGVLYSYGFKYLSKTEYNVTYFYDENESFTLYEGRHRILTYLSYPLIFYRNKAQKEYLKFL